jgi:hypothetical protein
MLELLLKGTLNFRDKILYKIFSINFVKLILHLQFRTFHVILRHLNFIIFSIYCMMECRDLYMLSALLLSYISALIWNIFCPFKDFEVYNVQ